MSPQAPFLTDRPEALASDAFGHRDYTDALYSIVAGDSPPPTVGIFGPWGVGKSTIIAGLQEKVATTEAAFVYFDAWRYEEDSLRRQFLLDAAADLKSAGKLGSYDPAKELRDLELDTQELQRSLGLSWRHLVRSVILALILGGAAFLAAEAGFFDAWLGGTFGEKVKVAAVTAGLTLLVGALSQTVSVDTLAMSRRSLSDPDRFEEKFRGLLAALRPKRLIVAIDNLDRCSPEKAVELLATIKTYLEPSAGAASLPRSAARKDSGKEVIFVLAVDDEALRRHLIAQESERSEGAEAAVVRRYVEEYLAKFFGARLSIRPILGEDMRSYVAAHIAPLARARKLSDAEKKSLVSVVDAGLRGNPRGVKQFYNDLEVRLRLLEERESKKGERGPAIHPSVSGEVAMVAKLALIEREWPDAFRRLERDPRLLARWTLAARREPEVAWDGSEAAGPNPTGAPSRRAFATFLRRSARVESASLAALLSLKQSAIEVELPGFAEFREALTAGDRIAVADFLGVPRPRSAIASPPGCRRSLAKSSTAAIPTQPQRSSMSSLTSSFSLARARCAAK